MEIRFLVYSEIVITSRPMCVDTAAMGCPGANLDYGLVNKCRRETRQGIWTVEFACDVEKFVESIPIVGTSSLNNILNVLKYSGRAPLPRG